MLAADSGVVPSGSGAEGKGEMAGAGSGQGSGEQGQAQLWALSVPTWWASPGISRDGAGILPKGLRSCSTWHRRVSWELFCSG